MFMVGPAMAMMKRCQRGWDKKLPRIAGAIVHGVFAGHLDVTAERKSADAIVGSVLGKAQQTLAEADGKDFNANPKKLGGRDSGRTHESG